MLIIIYRNLHLDCAEQHRVNGASDHYCVLLWDGNHNRLQSDFVLLYRIQLLFWIVGWQRVRERRNKLFCNKQQWTVHRVNLWTNYTCKYCRLRYYDMILM